MAPSARRPARLLAFRWHLLGLAFVSLLPVVVFGALLVDRSGREERTETEAALVQRAQLLAGTLDREIAASLRALETLARSEQLARGDLAGFRREAVRVNEAQPSWIAVVLFTPDGRRIVDTRDPAAGGTTVDPVSFEEVLRTRRPTVGELVRARDGVTWAFALRTPVLEGESIQYVLTAAVSADEIGRTLSVGAADVEWTRTVVDRGGTIVARTRAPELWVGRASTPSFLARVRAAQVGLFQDQAFEGLATAVGYARAPLTGWTAAVVAPNDLLDEPIRRSTALLTLAGVASLGLSGAVAFFLSRRFARAVGSAADAAQALASGGPVAVAPCGIREVALLGDALSSSARLLEARHEDVERHLARIAEARREAEAASRAKDEFLAMLGHELRNPLAPIVTALAAPAAARRRRLGARARRSSSGRSSTSSGSSTTCSTSRASRAARSSSTASGSTLGERGRARGRDGEPAPRGARATQLDGRRPDRAGSRVDGDPARLAQVVANLLTNAAKYTPPGGHIARRARGARASGVVLAVRDNGIGIAPRAAAAGLRAVRAGATRALDRAEGGLGIGLTLVQQPRRAARRDACRRAARARDAGASSRVRLPARPASRRRPGRAASRRRGRGPPRRCGVLVVDDNVDAAELLAELLARRRAPGATLAHDGPAALAARGGARAPTSSSSTSGSR